MVGLQSNIGQVVFVALVLFRNCLEIPAIAMRETELTGVRWQDWLVTVITNFGTRASGRRQS
jgi:hypothetical protein